MQQSFARIKGVIEQIKYRAWLSSSPSIGCAVLQIDAAVTCCRRRRDGISQTYGELDQGRRLHRVIADHREDGDRRNWSRTQSL